MAKSVCEPDRVRRYICEMCGRKSGNYTDGSFHYKEEEYFFLSVEAIDTAAKIYQKKEIESTCILCPKCQNEISKFIQAIRYQEHYYEQKCHRLEEQSESKKPKRIVDNRLNKIDILASIKTHEFELIKR